MQLLQVYVEAHPMHTLVSDTATVRLILLLSIGLQTLY